MKEKGDSFDVFLYLRHCRLEHVHITYRQNLWQELKF